MGAFFVDPISDSDLKGKSMSTRSHLIISLFLLASVSSTSVFAQQNVEFFDDFSARALPGRLYTPPEAANGPRPVIVFLHGAGERGTNNFSQINGNINNLLSEARSRGAYLYAPQITSTSGAWDDARTLAVMSKTNEIIDQLNGDPNRMYVTGLSLGGGGTWNMASRFADRFAAAVPIAGVNPAGNFEPSYILDLPTWAFHARNDSVVSANNSRNRVNQMVAATNQPPITTYPQPGDASTFTYVNEDINLRYTEWASGGHNIWGRVYADATMNDWMFAQAVPEPEIGLLVLMTLAGTMGLRSRRKRISRREW